MRLKTMNGIEVYVEADGAPYRPATFEYPEEGGVEELTHVWYEGVDILPLLREDEYDYIMGQIDKHRGREDDDWV